MLDRYGFKRKTYGELLSSMDTKARELFGDDINTSVRSPLGLIIRLFAWFLSKTWELAEKVYNSRFVSKAEGVQLDYLTAFYNTKRQPALSAFVDLKFTGTPGHRISTGTQFTTEDDVYFILTEDVALGDDGTGTGTAVAMDTGAIGNVEAHAITVQAEPDADVESVTNPERSSGGRDEETDIELKSRLLDSPAAQGNGTADAVRAAVMSVPGVRAASVVVNNTIEVVDGDEPKSIHVYALDGGREDIAEAIHRSKGGGIGMNGNEVITVLDASGNEQEIRFDYAAEIAVYSRVTLKTNAAFPSNGVEQVYQALIQTIGGTVADGTHYAGLDMGEDVYNSRLVAAVMAIPGVVNATVQIGTSAGALSVQDIEIAPREVAQTLHSWIEVITA